MCDKVVEKDSEMLKFVQNHFKTPEICEKFVKSSFLSIIHVPDQCKTPQICERKCYFRIYLDVRIYS